MAPILPGIESPDQVSGLSPEELRQLADELRAEILRVVSEIGGHLGASLGVAELTVALHHAFDSPRDKIVWDVGHQAYGHKLLTGRREQFSTIRQYGGISGFPKRSESEHDTFGVGHASTAISAALGYCKARDLRRERHHVIAVVGDGALTGGIAYEGMNNAGQLDSDLIVILNDNEMSISRNVGAMSRYLTQITSGRVYTAMEAEIFKLLGRLPKGTKAQDMAGRVKEALKTLMVPGQLFESLGFRYFGPLDGHDIDLLVTTFEQVKNLKGPTLLHVITCKGKGYSFAEKDAAKYHGVSR
ncbi:MAG TPA: 1-deoxy-D-xylulose-5-phosphate synthase N-terminal domain-containing protein, partial [Candidatus Krumholzibacteria bacterium]|nr:1-deoxy-D-xylulose-5-phosphate synthase N-terminal domain-containing protein [Candidatus Krumholzibacteria bacterium]